MMHENIVAIIVIYLSKQTISQYDAPYGGMQRNYQYDPYQNIPYQPYPDQLLPNNKWNEENVNYKDYNDYEENVCDCTKCDELRPGCLNSCPNCISTPQPFPQNYVILPFPYPFPVTPKETAAPVVSTQTTTTTAATTTTITTTTTTTEAPITTNRETEATSQAITEVLETDMTMSPFHIKSRRPYLITSLRKTKPNWLPKYGIVPISDTFAEKLMLQLRNMKVLHPRADNAKNAEVPAL